MSKFTVKITTPLIQEGKAQTAQTINKIKYLESFSFSFDNTIDSESILLSGNLLKSIVNFTFFFQVSQYCF